MQQLYQDHEADLCLWCHTQGHWLSWMEGLDESSQFCLQPTSTDTFHDKHIPHEVVHVCQKQVEVLHQLSNLTIWHWPLMTTLSESSKVQCTQPMPLLQTERHSFLMVTWAVVMNVKQLSGLRRSYWRYVFHIALGTWLTCSQTVHSVGELQWAATCSDSTNVTKAVCWEIIKEIVTMLNLNDCIHHLHNTIGDINKIIMFK